MKNHDCVLIKGDGIGPEISASLQKVFHAAGAPINWVERHAGVAALERGTKVLPDDTVEAMKDIRLALKGPCSTPIGKGFVSVNVAIRKTLNFYAALRPVRTLEGVKTRFDNVDIVVVRENTEGLYAGLENEVTPGVVASMKVATTVACHRIAHWAFRWATHKRRKKITVFHKANIMKLSDGLFLNEARKTHKEDYPNIDYNEMIIDAGCMKLVQDPSQFDILLLENLYGDVVSDLCAGLVGGLGVVPGANFGDDSACFEAVHGSAPDIAGQNKANPLALIMSGVMMLNFMADEREDKTCGEVADAIKAGYNACMREGQVTRDLGGTLSTTEFTDKLIERLGAPAPAAAAE